jgi:hypothetical protein
MLSKYVENSRYVLDGAKRVEKILGSFFVPQYNRTYYLAKLAKKGVYTIGVNCREGYIPYGDDLRGYFNKAQVVQEWEKLGKIYQGVYNA